MNLAFRRQLPVRSPVPAAALLRAAPLAFPGWRPRQAPAALLRDLLVQQHDARDAILCGSGTHALALGLRVAAAAAPGPVALPAYGCFDLATAAVGADVGVTFYDVDPDTLAPVEESLLDALNAGARTVVVAPVCGVPFDVSRILAAVHGAGGILIEDIAQAHGAAFAGVPVGSSGHLTVMSFGRGKGWTGGRGGALVVREESLLDRVRATTAGLPTQAAAGSWCRAAAAWLLGRPALYSIPASIPWLRLGSTIYHEPTPPSRMDEVAVDIVLRSAEAARREIGRRRRNAVALLELLDSLDHWVSITLSPAAEPSWLRLPVRSRTPVGALPSSLTRLGVAPAYPMPLPLLPALTGRVPVSFDGPGAAELCTSLLTLPVHGMTGPRDRLAIARALGDPVLWQGSHSKVSARVG
jgi:dTDP-4-amino-4,6-dideoxygalactose transaminase